MMGTLSVSKTHQDVDVFIRRFNIRIALPKHSELPRFNIIHSLAKEHEGLDRRPFARPRVLMKRV